MEGNEFISVQVPRQHVTKVYELIVGLESGGVGDASEHSDASPKGPLTRALVERMYRESEPSHRKLMKYLADRPDERIGTREIAEGLGLQFGARSLAGSLGAFGNRAEHRYGGLKPWESRWSEDKGEAEHRMSQEVATWVKETAS